MVYSVAGTPNPNVNPNAFYASSLHGAMLEGPGGGSSWQFDISKGTRDKIPTTDPLSGEIRPKSVYWDYYLQCF